MPSVTYTPYIGRHSVSEIDTAIEQAALVEDKQDALDSDQLAAVNSGITAEIVSKVQTRTNVIGFTENNTTSGGWIKASNGEVQEGNFYYTDYMSIAGYSVIGISCGVGQFAFYNSSKTYISGVTVVATDTHDYVEYPIPEHAAYVRFTVGNTGVGNGFYALSNGSQVFNPVIISTTKYGGQFRKLRDGIEYAERFTDAKVYVRDGSYDLCAEFASEIANVTNVEFGIVLKNGVHVVFSPKATVTAIYTGSNADIPKYFAPFRVEAGGDDSFTLENLDIQTQNTRYCVHDELTGRSSGRSGHIYRNCRMYHDNVSITLANNGYAQCIGGGCGRQTYVEITNCEFKSKRAETSATPLVSFHNAINAADEQHDGRSAIYITNSYFHDKGYARATYYGDTTQISKFVINNCSLGDDPIVKYEVNGASTPENFEMLEFNNVVREET